jgi:molybdopterin-guanine dinucleotide biosynthesis protein A
MFSGIACGILAGGEGKRLGRDKPRLRIGGKPLIESLIDRLRPFFKEIFISSNTRDKFLRYDLPVYPDLYPLRCPLTGIYSILTHSPEEYTFVIACDIIPVDIGLIRELIYCLRGTGAQIVVPRSKGGLEPLYGIYSKGCLGIIRGNLQSGRLAVRAIFDGLQVKAVDTDAVLFNINTLKDYRLALKAIGQGYR